MHYCKSYSSLKEKRLQHPYNLRNANVNLDKARKTQTSLCSFECNRIFSRPHCLTWWLRQAPKIVKINSMSTHRKVTCSNGRETVETFYFTLLRSSSVRHILISPEHIWRGFINWKGTLSVLIVIFSCTWSVIAWRGPWLATSIRWAL